MGEGYGKFNYPHWKSEITPPQKTWLDSAANGLVQDGNGRPKAAGVQRGGPAESTKKYKKEHQTEVIRPADE